MRWLARFQCVSSVAHTGGVEVDTQVAPVQPNFSEQRMPGELHVKLCYQLDCRADAVAVERVGKEFERAKVVIDMPDTIAAGLGDAPQQSRTVVAHATSRQPALLYQFAPAADFGFQTLDDHLTSFAVNAEAEAEDTRGARLQSLLLH